MALLPILVYPDPKLHTVARPVETVDDAVRTLVNDMFDTMYEAKGVGLAATQVDVHRRVVVMDVSESRNERVVLINPEIEWLSEERGVGEEGCLSVPGAYDGVERATRVRVRALDENGNSRTIEADGLMAVCIQHEIDHLNGKVFIEYLSLSSATASRRDCSRPNGRPHAPQSLYDRPERTFAQHAHPVQRLRISR